VKVVWVCWKLGHEHVLLIDVPIISNASIRILAADMAS
jgi:hypothetical protein